MTAAAYLPSIGLLFDNALTLVAEQGNYAVSGQDAVLQYSGNILYPGPLPHLALLGGFGGNVGQSETGTYAVSGQDASLFVGYRLIANAGFYVVTGQPALFDVSASRAGDPAPLPHIGLLLAPSVGAYTLTADPGIYTITGSDGLADFEMSSATTTYTISGQDANLLTARILTAETGAYAISGQDAEFQIGAPDRVMAADFGLYQITGSDAALVPAYALACEQGFYPVLGQAANLVYGVAVSYSMLAEYGDYQVTGQDVALVAGDPVLAAESGSYSIDGIAVRLEIPSRDAPTGGWGLRPKKPKKKKQEEVAHVVSEATRKALEPKGGLVKTTTPEKPQIDLKERERLRKQAEEELILALKKKREKEALAVLMAMLE